MRRSFFVLVAALLTLPASPAVAAPPPPLGTSKVIAHVPAPGFPEGIAVKGNKMYVASPAQNGHKGAAHVFAFDINSGALLRDYPIPASDPITDHGLVGVALDGSGRLYVADIQRGIVRLDLTTGQTATYAVIPDLHPCTPLPLGPCSPTLTDRPPFPNDIVFDSTGNAYVTDSFQATIWRIPPGGQASPWFQDIAFDTPLGPNGIRLTPDDSEVCFAITGPPGSIQCVRRVNAPVPADRRVLHSFLLDGPDNFAFGQTGNLYVALALVNQVAVLRPDGAEVRRFSGPAKDGAGAVPWDAPAGVAFDNSTGSLLVTNHALVTGLLFPNRFVVFDVYVNDRADPLAEPVLP
jgi:DNA-binding beta-propeller fold protein YncE